MISFLIFGKDKSNFSLLIASTASRDVFPQTPQEEFVRKFATQDTERKRIPPASGPGTLCGVIIESQSQNLLAKSITPIKIGGRIGN